MTSFVIHVDGASRGNPGAAGIGVVVCDESGKVVREIGEYIGQTTNNVAEYTALIRGLEEVLRLGGKSIMIHTDSELLARQIAGIYRVRAPHLAELYSRARALLSKFPDAKIGHVPREHNAHADRLASDAARRRADVRTKDVSPSASRGKPLGVTKPVPKRTDRPTPMSRPGEHKPSVKRPNLKEREPSKPGKLEPGGQMDLDMGG
jgi:ribonuclease HI